MNSEHLDAEIRALLGHPGLTLPAGGDSANRYHEAFQRSGVEKAQGIVEDLAGRSTRIDVSRCAYFSIGGSTGAELAYALEHTPITHGLLLEYSDKAIEFFQEHHKPRLEALGKTVQAVQGDAVDRLEHCNSILDTWRQAGRIDGVVCSVQAVLHELPTRSRDFKLPRFLANACWNWNPCLFYSREPCGPSTWPERVKLAVPGIRGSTLLELATRIRKELGFLQPVQRHGPDHIELERDLAIEVLFKIFYRREFHHEMQERTTSLDPKAFVVSLRAALGPHARVSETHEPSGSFEHHYREYRVDGRKCEDGEVLWPEGSPQPPDCFIRVIGERVGSPRVGVPIAARMNPEYLRTATEPVLQEGVATARLPSASVQSSDASQRRIYENLPAPRYSTFIERPREHHQVSSALTLRTPIVAIVGFPGTGKTSLAREVADRCVHNPEATPRFDAVVWLDDKIPQGSGSLSYLLTKIASTLDYPGIAAASDQDKLRDIDTLLRSRRVLLIVDNFERIADRDLLRWLANTPEPSKAIITSREQFKDLHTSGIHEIHIKGLHATEARSFIKQRAQLRGIDDQINDDTAVNRLLEVTGGNPKALELALGLLTDKRKTLEHVIRGLRGAQGELFDELFNDLFAKSWQSLEATAQHVLLSMNYFPYGSSTAALEAISSVTGAPFEAAMDRLVDSSLLDVTRGPGERGERYQVHPILAAFLAKRLEADPDFEHFARDRWIAHLRALTARVGFCWDDVAKLKILDDEGIRETVCMAIEWTLKNGRYSDTITLAKDARYYFYVRGLWSMQPSIHLLRAAAARALSNPQEEFDALVYHANIAAKQGNLQEVEKLLPRLDELRTSSPLSADSLLAMNHARALYLLAQRKTDEAEAIWRSNLAQLAPTAAHAYSANSRWLGVCLYKQHRLAEAREVFMEALPHAKQHGFLRAEVSINLQLLSIALDESEMKLAKDLLAALATSVEQVQDRAYLAALEFARYRYALRENQLLAAEQHLIVALDLFERLGLAEEQQRALTARTELETAKRSRESNHDDRPQKGP